MHCALAGVTCTRGQVAGCNVVKVLVANVYVEHEVKLKDFTKWLDRASGLPREVSDRQKIRSILGIPVSTMKLESPQLSTSRLIYINKPEAAHTG